MAKGKVHRRNTRLYVNAGISSFPDCYYEQKGPLDMDKTGLLTTNNKEEITCKRCIKIQERKEKESAAELRAALSYCATIGPPRYKDMEDSNDRNA